jgi:hypothetical protein
LEGPLIIVDHHIPAAFTNFLAMHQDIYDKAVYHQLQNDLVEHLWVIKGGVDDCCFSSLNFIPFYFV